MELHAQDDEEIKPKEKLQGYKMKSSYVPFLAVSAVTFSNGGDNIGVYRPLFAKYSSAFEVTTLISVFMTMTAVWCAIGYYLISHPLFEKHMRHFGHIVLPFVLIGLGLYILVDAFLI